MNGYLELLDLRHIEERGKAELEEIIVFVDAGDHEAVAKLGEHLRRRVDELLRLDVS